MHHQLVSKIFRWRSMLPLIVTIVVSLLAGRGLWQKALPLTYDIHHHAARAANYYLALTEGQFPPRWAPNLYSNFGYPIFSLVYPLPYILTTPLFILTNSIELSVNLIMIFSLLSAGVGAWLMSYLVTKNKGAAVVSSLIYGLSPYLLVNIYTKGAIAEGLFIGLLPWMWVIFFTLDQQRKIWWQVLTYVLMTALLLSHHLSLIMAIPLFMAWFFWHHWTMLKTMPKQFLSTQWRFLVLAMSSVLTTVFFWLPMLLEKGLSGIAGDFSVISFAKDFAHWPNLFWSTQPGTLFSLGAFNAKSSTMIGLPIWLAFAGVIWWLARHFRSFKSSQSKYADLGFWLATFVLSVFLMLPVSESIWKVFTPLQYMQFPVRLLWLAVLSGTLVFCYAVKQRVIHQSWFRVIAVVSVAINLFALVFWAHPRAVFSEGNHVWLEYPYTTTSYNELKPSWFAQDANLKLNNRLLIRPIDETKLPCCWLPENSPIGHFQMIKWTGSAMQYKVNLSQASQIMQRTMYYPGWEVRVDNQLTKIEYLDPVYSGRIIFPVSAGQHEVSVQFTNHVWYRQLADSLSLLGIVVFLSMMIGQTIGGLTQNRG